MHNEEPSMTLEEHHHCVKQNRQAVQHWVKVMEARAEELRLIGLEKAANLLQQNAHALLLEKDTIL